MKFQERVKMVQEAFDLNALKAICLAPQEELVKYGETFLADGGKGDFAFFHKDIGSDVLAIAHMDTVQKERDFGYAMFHSGREVVFSPQLDDRLGVYVICELLPKLGIKTDLLLTTDEERGKTTGRLFETTKKYRWMFQFDRMGDDVVMYQYRTDEAQNKLKECDFKTGIGSASDISQMDDLGCLGFNFGVGYEDAHSKDAYGNLSVLYSQVAKFMKFHHKYEHEHMVYDKTAKKSSGWSHSYSGYSDSHFGGYTGTNFGGDYESEFGRRINGIWLSKMIWDDKTRLSVINQYLYKHHPETKPVSDEEILWRNCKSMVNGVRVYSSDIASKWTEKDILAIARGELIIVGETKALESPKGDTGGSSTGSSGSEAVTTILYEDNDPCQCGHSYFIHRRIIWGKHGSTDACDMWKCGCSHFREQDALLFGKEIES